VLIGSNCDIAPGVFFITGSHYLGSHERRAGKGFNTNISIGDGSWIGASATILPGVKIGPGCVVAACACVTEDVPQNFLTGGVPAKVIRKLDN
jgi:maltose O-acetyltransferase